MKKLILLLIIISLISCQTNTDVKGVAVNYIILNKFKFRPNDFFLIYELYNKSNDTLYLKKTNDTLDVPFKFLENDFRDISFFREGYEFNDQEIIRTCHASRVSLSYEQSIEEQEAKNKFFESNASINYSLINKNYYCKINPNQKIVFKKQVYIECNSLDKLKEKSPVIFLFRFSEHNKKGDIVISCKNYRLIF
jgi:hypothetical protein